MEMDGESRRSGSESENRWVVEVSTWRHGKIYIFFQFAVFKQSWDLKSNKAANTPVEAICHQFAKPLMINFFNRFIIVL